MLLLKPLRRSEAHARKPGGPPPTGGLVQKPGVVLFDPRRIPEAQTRPSPQPLREAQSVGAGAQPLREAQFVGAGAQPLPAKTQRCCSV